MPAPPVTSQRQMLGLVFKRDCVWGDTFWSRTHNVAFDGEARQCSAFRIEVMW